MITLSAAPRARRAALLLLVVALAVAACGSGPGPSASPSGATPTPPGSAAPSTDQPTGEPTATGEPAPTEGSSGEPEPTDEPTPTPTPQRTAIPDPAAVCTGNAENRAFYAAVAGQVAWDVYCPVLPAGWFVDAGNFRLAGGGRLEIAYKGPGGARLEIREGSYCDGDAACLPTGPDAGSAAFGDRPARLFDVGDGRWLVVAQSSDILWEVRTSGLARDVAVGVAADFARVGR